MGFLGQDWGLQNLKNKGQGLLSDPNQAMESPWFNMGMGLLSENQKPFGGDPFGAAMGGMRNAKLTKQERLDRERIEELRKQLAIIIAAQQQGPQQSPLPPGQMPPQNIMDMFTGGGGQR